MRKALRPRFCTLLAGLALVLLALCFPLVTQDAVDNGSGERLKMDALNAGEVLEQPVTAASSFSDLALRVDGIRESKGLTLNVTLLREDAVAASASFPLKKARAGSFLHLTPETPLSSGSYLLRVEAVGEGNVKLGGQETAPCTLAGEAAATGCLVTLTVSRRTYGKTTLCCGALIALLAFVPSGGGLSEEKRRTRLAPRAHRWLLPLLLAAGACTAFLAATHSGLFGLGAYTLDVEGEPAAYASWLGQTVHLPLFFFALCALWCGIMLLWELTRKTPALHRAAFCLILFGGAMMALCKPMMYNYGWDEGTHRELVALLAGPNAYTLPELTAFSSTWWFGYVPNALGMKLGSLPGLSEPWLYRLGDLSATAVYAWLCAEAVRRTPKYTLTFLFLGALPSCIVVASGFTYDAMVLAGLLLGAALLLQELSTPEELLTGPAALRLVTVFTLCTLCKPAYSFALLSLFTLPRSKFQRRSRHTLFVLFVLVLLLACLGSSLLGSYADMMGGDSRMEGTDSAAQLHLALTQPLSFLGVLGRFLVRELPWNFAWASALWGQFRSNGTAGMVLLAALLLLVPFASDGEEKVSLTAPRRLTLGAVALLPLLALMVTQYMVSSPVGGSEIVGMQPRYVLPVLPFVCLALMMPEALRQRLRCVSPVLTRCIPLGLAVYFFADAAQELLLHFFAA